MDKIYAELEKTKHYLHQIINGQGGRPIRKLPTKAKGQTVGGLRTEMRYVRNWINDILKIIERSGLNV